MNHDQARQRMLTRSTIIWRTREIEKLESSVSRQMERPSGSNIGIVHKHLTAIADHKRILASCAP
jgi:hypothetical protein